MHVVTELNRLLAFFARTDINFIVIHFRYF